MFSDKGIAWPGEKKKYKNDPEFSWSDVVPPPNWRERFPSYNDSKGGHPLLEDDERFQNWMRTAGLPTFSKLYGRNDEVPMAKGTYNISVVMSTSVQYRDGNAASVTFYVDFPVREYGGTKSIVISNVSWIGGRNPFLAWAFVGAAGLFMLLALIATTYHCVRPRYV